MIDEELMALALAGIAKPTANLQLPDKYLRDYYRNEEARIIWIEDEIDDSTLDVSKKIIYYNEQDKNIPVEDRLPIKIFLNTPGGIVPVMWQIVRVIKMSKTPVYTINFCDALSAGAHILAAGHKRFAFPGTTVLLHSGSCNYSGTVEQAENSKKYYDSMSKAANEMLLADTKLDPKMFKKKAVTDWYLSADEALEQGIIDKIVESFEEIF